MSEALINGLAGAGGGIIAQFITYPLQTVNTLQQTDSDPQEGTRRSLGTLERMHQVVKEDGWVRLYGGLMPSLVGTAASQGVYFYFYQIFRTIVEAASLQEKKIRLGDGSVGILSSLLVATLSGAVTVLFTNPIWTVVTRMQAHRKESNRTPPDDQGMLIVTEQMTHSTVEPYGTSHTVSPIGSSFSSRTLDESLYINLQIQEIYNEAGIWGFWKGLIPTLMMISNPSIQFMLYETMMEKLKQSHARSKTGSNEIAASEIFLLGALARLGAIIITYPTLVLKARLQAKQDKTGDQRYQYKGTWDAIIKIIRYEGFYGFYKGMSTKIVQSVLAAAVLFMMKEELVKGFHFILA